MRKFPTKVTQRDVRNALTFMRGGTEMESKKERAKPRQPEKEVMSEIREWARSRGDVTLWRNNVGSFEWAPGRWMRFGLCTGSSDFVGLTSMIVTPDLVGKRIAVMTCLEAKAEDGAATDEQLRFIEQIRDAGGIAGITRDPEDAQMLIERWHKR